MSRRAKQPAAASRRTTRRSTEQLHHSPAAPGLGLFNETQRVVSNPIFYCGTGGPSGESSKPPTGGDQLRCVYGRAAARALVHDPAAGSGGGGGIGNNKPLPLPPCRAHHRSSRVGPVGSSPRGGRVLRRAQSLQTHQDPFLAAYVACTRSSSGGERVRRQHEKKKTTREAEKGGVVRGCGAWNGWVAGAKYAGVVMSCKDSCAVEVRGKGASAAAAPENEKPPEKDAPPAGPTLDLSWAPVVLSARALERRREQR